MRARTLERQWIAPQACEKEIASEDGVSKSQLFIHRLLLLLVLDVILEGVTRKIAPQALGILIFFSKDLITLVLLLCCFRNRLNPEASYLAAKVGCVTFLLIPCLILTACEDPLLALFGLKQYALFPTVAISMCVAYLPNHQRELYSLFRLLAFTVIVTSCMAVAQNRLPAASWLNLSVGGDDLSGFSAGGYVRVSSTFPFVGQYCFYLNALCFCIPIYFYFRSLLFGRTAVIQLVLLLGFFIIGTFVTGSRGSVIGNAAVLGASGLLCVLFAGVRALFKTIALIALGFVLLGLIESQFPEFFAAYKARASGTAEATHAKEVTQRIEDGLLGWTKGSKQAPPSLLGYGLGVMSNGSDKFSSYARMWRSNGYWTETDQATTFFEGGWYLVLVWYGFRFWVILHCLSILKTIQLLEFRLMGCFTTAFILVTGIVGTLAIQPPLAIWWWLAVGFMICLSCLDRERRRTLADAVEPEFVPPSMDETPIFEANSPWYLSR